MMGWRIVTFLLCTGACCLISGFKTASDAADLLYIDQFRDLAVSEMHTHGIPASITLAQALVESDAGRSILAVRANNHFGIKCKSWWTGGKYFYADDDRDEGGRLTASCFRMYDSVQASFTDHSVFLLGSERYAPLFELRHDDYKSWAMALQKCGYATDPRYGQQLIRVIEEFGLDTLDLIPAKEEQHSGN